MKASRRLARLSPSVTDSSGTRTLLSTHVRTLLLAASACAGVIGILKGGGTGIVNDVDFYWMIDYRHGLIKRGLVGTLFHPLFARTSLEFVGSAVPVIHFAACLVIICLWWRLFAGAVDRERSLESQITLTISFLWLMCCPLLPTLGYMVGYLDVYVILVALVAVSLIIDGHHGAASVVAAVGPLVHESFVFLWAPVMIMLAWSCLLSRRHLAGRLAAIVLPILVAFAVVGLHDQAAVVQQIQRLPLTETARSKAIFQLGLTFQASFNHMRRYEYPGHVANVIVAMAYFLMPAAGLLWAAAFVNWRRWSPRSVTFLVVILATLTPLALLSLAWDLSRFLLWSTLAAAFALVGSGSPHLLASGEGRRD